MNELEALIVLVNVALGQPEKVRLAVEELGSATACLSAPVQLLARLPGFGETLSGAIRRWEQDFSWRRDLELIAQRQVEAIPFWDSRFPRALRHIPDPPVLLYVSGSLTAADQQACAIVGTRKPTAYAAEVAHRLAKDLAELGFTIVSGLEPGIDTLAHRGALKSGRTIAVIGSGLAAIYPPENEPLAREITPYGAVISELPMQTAPTKGLLARRHRLIGGLAAGIILIESALKGTAMLTMREGWRLRRRLFALPGQVNQPSFRGNHLWIKQRRARLVEDARDVVKLCDDLSFSLRETAPPQPESLALLNGSEIHPG
jgi:DNA processing protein